MHSRWTLKISLKYWPISRTSMIGPSPTSWLPSNRWIRRKLSPTWSVYFMRHLEIWTHRHHHHQSGELTGRGSAQLSCPPSWDFRGENSPLQDQVPRSQAQLGDVLRFLQGTWTYSRRVQTRKSLSSMAVWGSHIFQLQAKGRWEAKHIVKEIAIE